MLLTPAFLEAQSTPPPSGLATLRLQFDRDITAATKPEWQQYITELTALEKRAAAARDYAAAIELAAERKAAEAELASLEKRMSLIAASSAAGSSSSGSILLQASEAKLNGLTLEAATNSLTGWSKSGASATWTLPNLPPGGYEVVLVYSCSASEGGSLTISESFYTLTRDIMPDKASATAGKKLGTLRVQSGAGTLTLAARTVLGGNLMHLQRVELLPASR